MEWQMFLCLGGIGIAPVIAFMAGLAIGRRGWPLKVKLEWRNRG